MMQIAGNFLLFLCLLALAFLFNLIFLQKPSGGDASIGHAYATMYLMIGFLVLMVLVACIIGFGGGFSWLSLGRFAGGGLLALCFLIILLGATLGMDAGFMSIRFFGLVNAVVTWLVLMVAFAVLLNENLKMIVPPTIVKWGLAGVLSANSLVLVTVIFGAIVSKVGPYLPSSSDKLDGFDLHIVEKIDTCDASKGIASLFIYGGDNQPKQIREKARLKIKSKPDWQVELYKELEGGDVFHAFGFLLSNDVDDKPLFAKGVYQGVLNQARLIREDLRRCWHQSHLKDGKFRSEISRSLEAVEMFKDLGVDFKPAVTELRAALDEPIEYDNLDLSSKKMLDKWLKKH